MKAIISENGIRMICETVVDDAIKCGDLPRNLPDDWKESAVGMLMNKTSFEVDLTPAN